MTDAVIGNFEAFKRFYPKLEDLQSLQETHVRSLHDAGPIDWNEVVPVDFTSRTKRSGLQLTPFQENVGKVIFDAVAICVGAVGLRPALRSETINLMFEAVSAIIDPIKAIIAQIGKAAATISDQAYGFFRIVQEIYRNGKAWKKVWNAFVGNLTWYNMLLYGISGIATIGATFLSGGAALVAEILILLVAALEMVSDIIAAYNSLDSADAPPAPEVPKIKADHMPIKANIAIRTGTNNLFSIVNGGGLAAPNNGGVMATDRRVASTWEQFTLVPLSLENSTFALRTASGNYVGAVDAGGLGGPNDAFCPIHTDATEVGDWEKLVLIKQNNGTYAISTTSGYYLTAMWGGGVGGPNDSAALIHTDATRAGGWETFTFDQIEYAITEEERDGMLTVQ